MSRSLKAHILLVLVTFVWGATFVVIKQALDDASPLLFNSVRMTLASVCLLVLYRKELRGLSRATLLDGALVGTFMWLGYALQTTGLKLTTPAKSGFLTGVSVVLVPLFLALFWKKAVNRWSWIGVGAAFAGLVLMTVPSGEGALADWSSVNRGDLLTLACAAAFTFHIIFLGRATKRNRFEPIAFLQIAVAAALMIGTIPFVEEPRIAWSARVLWAIGITGVLGTAAAFTIQAWAQQFTPPTHTVLIFALEPVFAMLTSYVVLGERMTARATAGAALILAGVLVSELMGPVPVGPEGPLEEGASS